MHVQRGLVVLFGVLVACEKPQTDPPKPETREPELREREGKGEPEAEPKPAGDPNTCMPPGLEQASKVETLALPRGCQVTAAGSLSAPTIVRSESELAGAITCEAGSSLPAIDFTKHQLHVAEFMLSPAYGGSELFDDGKTVTFVQRDRGSCPDDPLPMPIGSAVAYLLPQGAERDYAQRSCSLPAKCD